MHACDLMDRQNLLNLSELIPNLRRHPRMQLLATGHVHRAALTLFAGVPTTMCPAPNHAVDLDLAGLREPSFKVEPPAFHLHSWFPGEGLGTVVTHQVPIGSFGGPHPFSDPMESCSRRRGAHRNGGLRGGWTAALQVDCIVENSSAIDPQGWWRRQPKPGEDAESIPVLHPLGGW